MGRSCASDGATSGGRVAAAPPDEEAALRAALVSAGQQIAKLAEAVGGDAAQILEFQVALLEDDDFLDPIFAAIVEGVPAHTAWSSALEAQIADYNAAADEYLQARSSDLADLRDRVLRTLRGGESEAPKIPGGAVVCAEDLPPSQFLEIDWSGGGGLALLRGSPTSHVAMLARARGIPMVVQLGSVPATPALRCSTARAPRSSSIPAPNRSGCSSAGGIYSARTGLRRVPFCAAPPRRGRARRYGC